MKRNPTPRFHTTDEGMCVATIQLTNAASDVQMTESDFRKIQEAGYSTRYFLNAGGNPTIGYVRASTPKGNTVSLSRVIAGAEPNQHVHYLDGNRCNLQASNLEVFPHKYCLNNCSFQPSPDKPLSEI